VATFPAPTDKPGDRSQVLLGYLDFFRATVAEKVSGLSDRDLRRSILPSGWTLLELVKHLVFMERRWLVWGFLGEQVTAPWGDQSDEGHWAVESEEAVEVLLSALEAGGRRTREIVQGSTLSAVAATGGRFPDDAEAPTLERILLHVLQEYARHCGHLDVVRELMDGVVGE
jgi:uncharacterized damage-inducible protein DinB